MVSKAKKVQITSWLLLSLVCLPAIVFSACRATRSLHKHRKEKERRFASGWLDSNIHYPVLENKPIVVIVAAYDNIEFCEKNLQSIFDQTYQNYRVVYIDNSIDKLTWKKAKAYSEEQNKGDKFSFVHNPGKDHRLENIYRTCHSSNNNEIIVFIEGKDWFAHEKVLERINHVYQNPIVWMTYGSGITYPDYGRRTGELVKSYKSIRESQRFTLSMPHTCYAGLFKQIRLEDFLSQGEMLSVAGDIAYMIPLMEMAHKHAVFIPEPLYMINDPDHKHFITDGIYKKGRSAIRKKPRYQPLPETFHPCQTNWNKSNEDGFDLVVISKNNPLLLVDSLEEYQKQLLPTPHISVFFKASNKEYLEAYKQVIKKFPEITFLQDEGVIELYLESIKEKKQPYLALVTDNFSFKEKLVLENCIKRVASSDLDSFVYQDSFEKRSASVVDNSGVLAEQLLQFKKSEEGDFFVFMRKEHLP